jgi:hypothetical protein
MFPGYGEQMRAISRRYVPTAANSRQTAGICGQAVVINLPGNPGAIKQVLPEMLTPLAACVAMLGKAQIRLDEAVASKVMAAASGTTAAVPQAGASQSAAYEVDKVNVEWLASVTQTYSLPSTSDVIARILKKAAEMVSADALMRTFIFDKVRGADRKKVKQSIDLALPQDGCVFLERMMQAHNIPSIGKALRIVLDWALEDGDEASMFA